MTQNETSVGLSYDNLPDVKLRLLKDSRNDLKNEFGDRVTLAVIPKSSHALLPEQPKLVVEAIAGWVRGLK